MNCRISEDTTSIEPHGSAKYFATVQSGSTGHVARLCDCHKPPTQKETASGVEVVKFRRDLDDLDKR